MLDIRPEHPEDVAAIRQVVVGAFEGPAEAALVDRLRADHALMISLVALTEGELVGHIAFSPVTVSPPHSAFRGVALAPLSVTPGHQDQGIGSQLVTAGLTACRAAGAASVVVLGHPTYYPRFGFRRASAFGLANTFGADDAFMALALQPGALDGVAGTLHYAPAFDAL